MQHLPLKAINEVIEYLQERHVIVTGILIKAYQLPADDALISKYNREQMVLLQALMIANDAKTACLTNMLHGEPQDTPSGECTHWLPGLAPQVPQSPQPTSVEYHEMRRRHRELIFTRMRLQLEPEDPSTNRVLQDVEREIEVLEQTLGPRGVPPELQGLQGTT